MEKFYNSGVGKPLLCIKVWKPQKVDQFTYKKNKFFFATYGTFSIIKVKFKKPFYTVKKKQQIKTNGKKKLQLNRKDCLVQRNWVKRQIIQYKNGQKIEPEHSFI